MRWIWARAFSLWGYFYGRVVRLQIAQDDHLEATRVTSSALAIFTVAGLLAISASVGFAFLIDDVFRILVLSNHLWRYLRLVGPAEFQIGYMLNQTG